jgi:6-pyruvoyltetrahydropterin/6-carboxytetrahydropterin synthase
MHGHSFRFDVIVEGNVEADKGYLIDYGDIKAVTHPVVQQLDHYVLNEIPGLANPTAETLSRWIYDRLKPSLPQLAAIIVHETCTSSCEYRG